MNNLIWISFTNSGALFGKGPERLPRSELHWVPGFPDLFTFLKKLLSPHRTRPELDFLFHFWLLPSYSCSRYSPPFPCILLCGSLSWLLCLTETLRGNERCGRKNNGHNDNNKPTGAGFSWTRPSLSIFKIYCESLTQMPGEGHETTTCNILGDLAMYRPSLGSARRAWKATLHPHPADETRHSDNDASAGGARPAVARRLWGFHPPLFGFTFTVCIIYNRHKLIWRFFS